MAGRRIAPNSVSPSLPGSGLLLPSQGAHSWLDPSPNSSAPVKDWP
jgi:hypothetical protein